MRACDIEAGPVSSAPNATRPILYDITRLVTRALNATPNGIDRVDFALARHFLSRGSPNAALVCTALGPRVAPAADAYRTIVDIEAYWNEFIDPSRDPVYEGVIAAFDARLPTMGEAPRMERSGPGFLAENWRAMRRWAFRLGRPLAEVPANSAYVNVSQFLADKSWFLRWLDDRLDVKPVFFVHDLLPIEAPEFFRPGERQKHFRAMCNISRLAAGVIVASNTIARRIHAFAIGRSREALPLCVAHLPVAPIFESHAGADERLADRSYFVVCGTIEPRKNHLMLLNVWRDLALRMGPSTPKLVVVGKRGWLNENIIDLLRRSETLRPHVIEVAGLSTPALRNLLAGARAALMPSFGEGFGLPIAEAAAAGAPIIASDIEAFREIGGDAIDYLDPLDGIGWRDAVIAYCDPASKRRAAAIERLSLFRLQDRTAFFTAIDGFVTTL